MRTTTGTDEARARGRRRRRAAGGGAVLLLTLALAVGLGAQRRYEGYYQGGNLDDIRNTPYDGRFTFVRVRFEPGDGGGGGFRRRDLKWDHDVPKAEINLMKILREVSILRPYMEGGNILTLDDPELFKYPIAYVSEPGFWTMTEQEAAGMRAYLQKGGFAIFDDFFGPHWYNFEQQIRRILPQARLVPMDPSHPIFDSFFHVQNLEMRDPNFGMRAEFWGVYEDNDPAKRLLLIANYNNDLGDFMEYSETGFVPIELSNEAYKLMVNYVMYGMTR